VEDPDASLHQLKDGSPVVLVDTWRDGSRLSWQIQAVDVLNVPYNSKEAAIRLISGHLKLTRPIVRANGYTQKGPDQGYLLAWRFKPIRRLALPRPADLKLQRHGWLSVDDPGRLAAWGL
jgi:hypothetical protein